MKILILSRYIYDESIPEFGINQTGLGMMINDIAKSTANYNDVLLLTRAISKGKVRGNYVILKHTWVDFLKSFSLRCLVEGVKKAIKAGENFKDRLKVIYFYLDGSYLRKIIKKYNPDIAHIHGIDESSEAYIKACEHFGIPYIVTLHGLIGLDDSVLASKYNKQLEHDFLKASEDKNILVTVISSGIKKRIIKNYGLGNGKNIKVITNGVDCYSATKDRINIRDMHNIPENNTIIVCIGNISKNKNQIQLVESLYHLSKETVKNITVIFVGKDNTNGLLETRARELRFERNCVFCGPVNKKNIASYFSEATLNIVASLNEGFGLSIIEGFVHGVPTVTFSDLDAIEDLYNDKAMLLTNERTSSALAESIYKALKKHWDKDWIKKYAEQFSLDKMAQNYDKIYKDILK